MIVKTQSVNSKGRSVTTTEHICGIAPGDVETRRNAARKGAPRGATRTIQVLSED